MFDKSRIESKEYVIDKMEVQLDGEDDLATALSNSESDYPMYNIKVERGFYTVYELKRKYDRDEKRILFHGH